MENGHNKYGNVFFNLSRCVYGIRMVFKTKFTNILLKNLNKITKQKFRIKIEMKKEHGKNHTITDRDKKQWIRTLLKNKQQRYGRAE